MTDKYNDIINLPHYEPKYHPRMSMQAKAAQFSPFAALTGYEAAIHETGRLTEEQAEISENQNEELNQKLTYLMNCGDHPEISVTYFEADQKKSGGAYLTKTSSLSRVDEYTQLLVLSDGSSIKLSSILALEGEIFDTLVW